MTNSLKYIKDASALIEAGTERGTGYLVTPDRAVTCEHVVTAVGKGGRVRVLFGMEPLGATVEHVDAQEDFAILKLDRRLEEVQTLALAKKCFPKDEWAAYGFPAVSDQAPIPLRGTVEDPEGKDSRKRPAIILYSPMIAAGKGAPAGGFSGTPVLVRGAVIGHLKRVIPDESYERRAEFGLIFACPIAYVLPLLPLEYTVRPDIITSNHSVVSEYIGQHYPSLKEDVINFDAEKKTAERFVGRKDLFRQLDVFASQRPCGYFRVVADAGLGKTALAAKVADEKKAPVFFTNASRARIQPKQCLNHLAAALIARCGLAYDSLPTGAGESSDFLGKILAEAAAKSEAPLWIVVDALDEAAAPGRGQNPLLLPDRLPRGVFILLTHRPGQVALVTAPGTADEEYRINWNDTGQQADIEDYLRQEADRPEIQRAIEAATPSSPLSRFVAFLRGQSKVDRFAGILKARSQGNFKYLEYVLSDIAAHQPGSGSLNLDVLPRGLMGYYQVSWEQVEPKPEAQEGWAEWNGLFRPTIAFLTAAREPVSAAWLAAQIGRSMEEVSERALRLWGRYLSRENGGDSEHWRMVHQSVADFTATKVNLREVHDRIATFYLTAWGGLDAGLPVLFDPARRNEFDEYGLRHLAGHLERAGRIDDVHRLLRLEHQIGGYQGGPVHVENAWYAAHEQAGQTEFYMNDLALAARLVTVTHGSDGQPSQEGVRLGLRIRYALMGASLNSLARSIPPALIAALIDKRVWSVSQGLAYARVSPPRARVGAFIAMWPHLNPQEGGALLREALDAARVIEDDGTQARALADLAPRLTDPSQVGEALAVARGIKDDEARAAALVALGRMDEALNAVAGIEDPFHRARPLADLAPRLANPSQVENALAIARKVEFKVLSDEPLAALVPRLAAVGRLEEALAIARGIEDESDRVKAFVALGRVEEALDVVRGIEDESRLSIALCYLAPGLANPDHLTDALAMAQGIADEEARSLALRDLAPHLAALGRVEEALAIVRGIRDERTLTFAYAYLAPHLTDLDQVEEALAMVRSVETEWWKREPLVALTTRLVDLGQLGEALTVIQEIRDETARDFAVASIAPQLVDAKQVQEVLAVVRRIEDVANLILATAALTDRPTHLVSVADAEALVRAWQEDTVSLALQITGQPLMDSERLQERLRQAEELTYRANLAFAELMDCPTDLESVEDARALVQVWMMKWMARFLRIGAFLPELSDTAGVQDAIAMVRTFEDDGGRALALMALAPRLVEPGQVAEALTIAREIRDDGGRALALGTLVPRLNQLGQLDDALKVAREIPKEGEWIRAIALKNQAPTLAAVPRARALSVWGEILQLSESRSRRDLLVDLTSLAPAITATGGLEASEEVCRAIEDVRRWWP